MTATELLALLEFRRDELNAAIRIMHAEMKGVDATVRRDVDPPVNKPEGKDKSAARTGSRNGHPLLRDRIMAALHGVSSASWGEIIDACQPTTPESLKICLRECCATGLVERVGRGRYALPSRVVEGHG